MSKAGAPSEFLRISNHNNAFIDLRSICFFVCLFAFVSWGKVQK